MVERALVDRQPRIPCHGDRTHDLRLGRGDVKRVEVDAGPHDVADVPLAEPQGLAGDRLLDRLEHALGAAGLEEVFDVIDRDAGLRLLAGTEKEEHRRRRQAHAPHERPGHPGEELHRRGGESGKRLGLPERQPLRHEFAEQQGHEREQHHEHGQRDRSGGSRERRRPFLADPRRDTADQPVAAVRCGKRADERDADLHRGQETIGTGREFEGGLGPPITLLGHGPQAAAPAGDDRHLRTGEESVGEDQQEDNQDFREHGRPVGGAGRRVVRR